MARESFYPALPFHAIRTLSFICTAIVTGAVVYFLLHLKADGFKLPWTLLIVFAAGALTLFYLIVTFFVHVCSRLSPRASLLCNIPLVLVWIASFSILTYNIYGTLGHSCSTENWGNSRGVAVCNVYKIYYSFVLFGLLSQIGLVVLDVRARKAQNREGEYKRMQEADKDVLKLDTFDSTSAHEVPYGIIDPDDRTALPRNPDSFHSDSLNPDSFNPGNGSGHGGANPYDQSAQTSHRDEPSVYSSNSRPNMYAREESRHQSSRSEVPMLRDYQYYGDHQPTAYQSGRYQTPPHQSGRYQAPPYQY